MGFIKIFGVYKNLKDAQDLKKADQFGHREWITVDTFPMIPASELNEILTELEMFKRAVKFFPIEYNYKGDRKFFDSVEEIEEEINRVKGEYNET